MNLFKNITDLTDIPINSVINADCLDAMKLIKDKSIDMILCDLPYGTTACSWDTIIPFEPLWEQYKRIIKDNGAIVLTASQPFTTLLISSEFNLFKYCWVWEKSNVGDIFNAKNKPMKKHEDICVFSKGTTANGSDKKMIYNPQNLRQLLKNNVKKNNETNRAFFSPRPSHKHIYIQDYENYPTSVLFFKNDKGLHPTQKPVALFEYLIKTYTNEGETVLDNCAGSGTTGIACINTNRNYILMEKEEKYFDVIADRIKNHVKETNFKTDSDFF